MEKYLAELGTIIRGQVELYEEQMSSAMAEGNEKDMRKINDDFEKEVGKNVSAFAEMAGEPLRSFLLSLFNNPCVKL
jgi:hypothetical protein